jgi:hypothetical protein
MDLVLYNILLKQNKFQRLPFTHLSDKSLESYN